MLSVVQQMSRFVEPPLRTVLVVGGDSVTVHFSSLANAPEEVIATPGRLAHLLSEVADLTLGDLDTVVYDESDRLFEMGFAAQVREIVQSAPPTRQSLLFSATMPASLAEFARAGLRDPEVMRLAVGAGVGKEKQKKPTKKGKKEAAPRRAAHAAEPVLQRHHACESRFGERCE